MITVTMQESVYNETYSREKLINLINYLWSGVPEECRATARFSFQEEYGRYESGLDDIYLYLEYERSETAEETAAREAKDEAARLRQEANQRAEYDRLKRIFGE